MWSNLMSFVPSWKLIVQAFLLLAVPLLMVLMSKAIRKSVVNTFALKPDSPSPPETEVGLADVPITGTYDSDIVTVRNAIGDPASLIP